jgi:hypothetical protein
VARLTRLRRALLLLLLLRRQHRACVLSAQQRGNATGSCHRAAAMSRLPAAASQWRLGLGHRPLRYVACVSLAVSLLRCRAGERCQQRRRRGATAAAARQWRAAAMQTSVSSCTEWSVRQVGRAALGVWMDAVVSGCQAGV